MNTVPVAVIIPYLDCRFIGEALGSIASQSMLPSEIVIVEGRQKGEDFISIFAWQMVVPHSLIEMTRVIQEDRPGLGLARNRGIRESKSPWIVPLDADDWLQPDYLEKCYRAAMKPAINPAFQAGPIGIVGPGLRHHGLAPGSMWERLLHKGSAYFQFPDSPVTREKLLDHNCLFNSSMFHREAWKEAGGYDENPRTYEDWDLWLSIVEKGWRIAVIDEPLINYRHHPEQSSKKMKPGDHLEYVEYIQKKHSA